MLNLSALKTKEEINPFETATLEFPEVKKVKPELNLTALTKQPSTPIMKDQTITDFSEFVWESGLLVKNIGQEIARNIGSAGVTVAKPIGRVLYGQQVDEVEVPKILQGIFREEPVKAVENRIADAELKIKDWGKQYANKYKDIDPKLANLGETVEKHALALAFTGIIADTGLDLTPLGGSKNAFKAVKQVDNIGDAINILKKMGVDDDLAKEFAEQVVKTKTDDAAKKLISHIAEVKKTTKPVLNTSALKPQPIIKQIGDIKIPSSTAKSVYKDPIIIGKYGKETVISNKYILEFKKPPRGFAISDTNPTNDLFKKIIDDAVEGAIKPANKFGEPILYSKPIGELLFGIKTAGGETTVVNAKYYNYLKREYPNAKFFQQQTVKNSPVVVTQNNKVVGLLMPATQDTGSIAKMKIINKADVIQFGKPTKIVKPIPKEPEPLAKEAGKYRDIREIIKPAKKEIPKPMIIRGETFTLGEQKVIQPTKKELRAQLKQEIKANKTEIKNAKIAQEKATKLEAKKQKIRQNALENIHKIRGGNTERIIKDLKKRHLSDEDIANVVLEDGTKLIDTVKVKRNPDGSLATVITKKQINNIKTNYTGKTPDAWVRKYSVERVGEKIGDIAQVYELPAVFFERKGLKEIYDTMIHEGERAAEIAKNDFLQRFKDAGLYKEGSWFTADSFKLSGKEADRIGKYFLTRQGKGYSVKLTDLTAKEKKFVEIFDGIIDDTEPRFFETAIKNGKNPGKVEDYAPIMTSDEIVRADQMGTLDFIMRKHPAFFSLKERAKKVPKELYETDYRKVVSRWLDGISKFINTGDVSQDVKYLLDSDQFKNIVNPKDYETVYNWYQDIVMPGAKQTKAGKAITPIARFLRQTSAMASLGLNYASVAKQVLTQVPLAIIRKAPLKFRSKFAKAFGINVKKLPSLTSRKGNIAIQDLQGKIGRIFTGPLTAFDKVNAQKSLNALLDKNWKDIAKGGKDLSDEAIQLILKKSQDDLDLWYGGMVSTGQRPAAFRNELGKFINMFIYPLTSQLNGFYRHIYQAKGIKKAKTAAEVAAAATIIAYLEQVITNLSPKWSDEKEMTKDTLVSLAGNIPIIGQIAWALAMDDELQVSAGVSGFNTLVGKLVDASKGQVELGEVGFSIAEAFGLPKQLRRTFYEGMEIIEEGGITDKSGKMLAPVNTTSEIMRSILRGKYGSNAAKDWVRNIGEKKENRRWFVPEVEFLQNGDYERKAELYLLFDNEKQEELRNYLSEAQQKKLDKALKGEPDNKSRLDEIFNKATKKKSLDEIFK